MILLTIYCLSSCLEEQLPEFAGSTLHNHLWSLLLPSFSPDNEPLNPDILPLTVFWIGVFAFIAAGTMKWFLWIYTVPGIEAWCSLRWSCFKVQLHFFWFFLRFMKYSEVSVMNLGLNYFLFFMFGMFYILNHKICIFSSFSCHSLIFALQFLLSLYSFYYFLFEQDSTWHFFISTYHCMIVHCTFFQQ